MHIITLLDDRAVKSRHQTRLTGACPNRPKSKFLSNNDLEPIFQANRFSITTSFSGN